LAKRSFKVSTFTPVAVADTTAMTSAGFMALQGGTATQFINVIEVAMGGQATSSAPSIMLLSRDSTVGGTPTALSTGNSDAGLNPFTAALAAVPVSFVAASTEPQRAAAAGLLNVSFNAFGGIYRWVAAPGEEIGMFGNVAWSSGTPSNCGEVSLSAYTGGTPGLMGAHIIYEPF